MRENLKIVHIILSKGYAGSEKYLCDLLDYQSNFFETHIIKLKANNLLNNYLNKKINIFEISNFFQGIRISYILKKIKPKIVHTHLGKASKLVKKSKNYKVISTLHMHYKKSCYKNCDSIIVSNNSQFYEVSKKFNGFVFKSYLWVKTKKISEKKSILKKKLNIPKHNYIFGSIGRFHLQKGFDIILNSFKKASLENATLILIGNDHDKYKNKIKNIKNVILLDHVDNVSNYYNIFDTAIFASRWETFGISLIEAMKFGLPIISSIHMGNKDWISRHDISKVGQNNEEEILKKIIYHYKFKMKKKKYDTTLFEYEKNCKEITDIYKKILQ